MYAGDNRQFGGPSQAWNSQNFRVTPSGSGPITMPGAVADRVSKLPAQYSFRPAAPAGAQSSRLSGHQVPQAASGQAFNASGGIAGRPTGSRMASTGHPHPGHPELGSQFPQESGLGPRHQQYRQHQQQQYRQQQLIPVRNGGDGTQLKNPDSQASYCHTTRQENEEAMAWTASAGAGGQLAEYGEPSPSQHVQAGGEAAETSLLASRMFSPLRICTGRVSKVMGWLAMQIPFPVLLVIHGRLLSPVQAAGSSSCLPGRLSRLAVDGPAVGPSQLTTVPRKTFIIADPQDTTHRLRCVFYEIDRSLMLIETGARIRIVGRPQMDGTILVLNVAAADPDQEDRYLPRMELLALRSIQEDLGENPASLTLGAEK